MGLLCSANFFHKQGKVSPYFMPSSFKGIPSQNKQTNKEMEALCGPLGIDIFLTIIIFLPERKLRSQSWKWEGKPDEHPKLFFPPSFHPTMLAFHYTFGDFSFLVTPVFPLHCPPSPWIHRPDLLSYICSLAVERVTLLLRRSPESHAKFEFFGS